MKERVAYFDILRAIAIIGVICIHAFAIDCHFDYSTCGFTGEVVWKQIINFSVPLFLGLSGYFHANKKIDNRNCYFIFLKKQIPRVLIPYFLWSIFYLSIDIIIYGTDLISLFIKFISFQASSPFYFILLIIQYYVLLPILQKMANIKGLIVAGIISAISCLVIFYFRYYTLIEPPLYIYGGSFTTWIVFFVLGIYIRKNGIKSTKSKLLAVTILCLALSIFVTIYLCLKFHNMGYAATATKISAFAYSFAIILYLFKFMDRDFKRFKLLSFIGEVSFGIYFSHMFVLQCIPYISNRLIPWLKSCTILYQTTSILTALICCTIFAYIARMLNKQSAIKYLGQ